MSRTRKLVVVGNGMVGYKLCEKLRKEVGVDDLEITVYGEEPRPAYDRVHLSSFFSGQSADDLLMAPRSWYEEHDVALHTAERVEWIDRSAKRVGTKSGAGSEYDELVLVTGSTPFVPDVPGSDIPGVFVYRTIEDLEAIEDYGLDCERGAVLVTPLMAIVREDLGLTQTQVGNTIIASVAVTVLARPASWYSHWEAWRSAHLHPAIRSSASPARDSC